MESDPTHALSTTSTRVAVIAVTAVVYAIGKGLTAYVPSPWGVGSLLVGIFLPAYFAVVSETVPAAVGAAVGTFIGDVIFLTPLGTTNPALSLIAGVPANFFAFLLFGWFVKRYGTWSGFVAATVAFVTLGNLIAATSVDLFGALVFAPAAGLASYNAVNVVLGLTVFWNTTSIPAIIIAVPVLIRATRPLVGRSQLLKFNPQWSVGTARRQVALSLAFAALFLLLGVVFLLGFYSSVSGIWPQLDLYVPAAALLVLVFAPLVSVVAGSGRKATQAAA